ncbi:alpha/beta fold hydrolase [Actinophytocola sp.]|uniref:alpha/beta fold hydrolase n=1 Tax=Actinophytocola sp. TaxID=1872138 RepID=UPI002ED626BB
MNPALVWLACAVGCVGLIALARAARRRFVVVTVRGESMAPALRHGDRVLVRRAGLSGVRRGDIVVAAPGDPRPERTPARSPAGALDQRPWMIKRTVALPGDAIPRAARTGGALGAADTHVPPGLLVVLGDNADASSDSRDLGYFRADLLLGVVMRRLSGASVDNTECPGGPVVALPPTRRHRARTVARKVNNTSADPTRMRSTQQREVVMFAAHGCPRTATRPGFSLPEERTVHSGMFDVDGAQLHYEQRGAGPALLLIPGAGGDAGYFARIAEELSDAFTVITYDRRGNSRSTGRTASAMTVDEQSGDAKALIEGLAGGAALVFGNSAGAIVGLDLAARHPEVVRGLIAHEPPVVGMLPADDPWRGFFDRMGARYHEAGPAVAGAEFVATVLGEGTYPWPEDLQQRFPGNVDHLFRWEWPAWGRFLPDEEALANAGFPIVLAAGSADRGLYYARPSVEIAARLGVPWVEFPGIHLEFLARPEGFAAALRAVATQMHTATNAVPAQWNSESAVAGAHQ